MKNQLIPDNEERPASDQWISCFAAVAIMGALGWIAFGWVLAVYVKLNP